MRELTGVNAWVLHGIHWVARAALRARPPLQAKALVDRFGGRFPSLGGADAARAAVHELFPAGTCLSRALTVAATVRGAEVVIGVDAWSGAQVSAHAWLEIDGVRVDTRPGPEVQLPEELARLPARRSHGRPQR